MASMHSSHPAASHDAAHDDHHEPGLITQFGFWLYLMSDCLVFAGLFASYAVLSQSTAGGPSAKDLFELPYVLVETFLLLLSSLSFGLGVVSAQRGQLNGLYRWLAVTAVLGIGFLVMELNEFHHLIDIGAGPDRSAFLSAFFTLVGTHGLHVTCGLLWMLILVIQMRQQGFNSRMQTRLACLSLFWHFLDIIWIAVFTIVYLMGVI